MAPIHYSLHYEDYSEHLMSRFGKLLQLQSLVDMTLMCSSHSLRVHKAVLAASSAYFQEVLLKQTGEPLIILKMRFSVLKSLVEFMYCGKTQCLEENLDELVSAAKFLKIKGLSKVTKEGLGINNSSELPIFTPPVVINRPPQSIIDLHTQDNPESNQPLPQLSPVSGPNQPLVTMGRSNPDIVVRMPFDVENGGGQVGADYPDTPRAVKPRRGRPAVRRTLGWNGAAGPLGRAAERALLRREQDSRKAIHHLKHLQSRHMQDYMDRVTLSQAVNSICGPESTTSHNYMNIDNDLMYVDQNFPSNVLNSTMPYSKEQVNETITSSYSNTNSTNSVNETVTSGISTAMTQYVNALKNAGLPTDLPILFESGDGSYINVNEQVLLDMVQSNEIQYEVIDQPNIIEKVTDASEIKSIDDLSKSIERGEMIMTNKSYAPTDNFGNETSQYNRQEDTINSLNAILPDNLESFAEQQNYVVLDPQLQHNHNAIDPVNPNDFSCIDGDMQFFTKSMSDDVKKYYEEHQLSDQRIMEHFCPASTTLDNNFSMSLLDSKNSHLNSNINQQFNHLNPEDIRRNEDCFDFGLQLPQTADFKDENLHCLMSTSKEKHGRNSYNDNIDLEKTAGRNDIAAQERDEIIKDLMNLENKIAMEQNKETVINPDGDNIGGCNTKEIKETPFNALNCVRDTQQNVVEANEPRKENIIAITSTNDLEWQKIYNENEENNDMVKENHIDSATEDSPNQESVIELSERMRPISEQVVEGSTANGTQEICKKKESATEDNEYINATLDENIPFAVGLLPLKQVQSKDDENILKRKKTVDLDLLDNVDAKCLKRKVKYKNM